MDPIGVMIIVFLIIGGIVGLARNSGTGNPGSKTPSGPRGPDKTIIKNQEITCMYCHGTGQRGTNICTTCGGRGRTFITR